MSLHQSCLYIEKTIERLYGIVGGIQIDGTLNDVEIARTKEWLETHKKLLKIEPFKSLHELLTRCLEDGAIDEQERDEILEWCGMFINDKPYPRGITNAVRRLHGILSGIRIDGVITDGEVEELRDYLRDYESYRENMFPFNELFPLLDRILSDGLISSDERKEISAFCKHFTERVVKNPVLYDDIYVESWMKTDSPIFEPLLKFCDFNHKIHFHGSSFCFTGPARYGKRADLFKLVEQCGGEAVNTIVHRLDYLVIGAQASPHWLYSTYGTKIQEANRCNDIGIASIVFLHEDEFVAQAKKYIEEFGAIKRRVPIENIENIIGGSVCTRRNLGWKLCFTGFDHKRTDELVKIAHKSGCTVVGDPCRDLYLLCYGDNPDDKLIEMAKNFDVIPASERDFFEILNSANNPLKVCFSGFNHERTEELTRIAYDNGFLVRKVVNKYLHVLCCGHKPNNNQIRGAEKYGASIVTEEEFLGILKAGDFSKFTTITMDDENFEHEPCEPPF